MKKCSARNNVKKGCSLASLFYAKYLAIIQMFYFIPLAFSAAEYFAA